MNDRLVMRVNRRALCDPVVVHPPFHVGPWVCDSCLAWEFFTTPDRKANQEFDRSWPSLFSHWMCTNARARQDLWKVHVYR